jgi:CheY-like chemotaxis protein
VRTILVVDNKPDNLALLRYILSRSDHQVVTALGGVSGLERARELHPDLVVIDLHMPDLDGWSLARCIRSDATFAGTRLLAVSVGPATEASAREAGFDEFFLMPFEPGDLIRTADALLEREAIR